MEARCPNCEGTGEYDPQAELFRCPHCGTTMTYEQYVETFGAINADKALDYVGRSRS
jgi:tRNA(Ile2) C34 agmatinyltransferase TiaS